MAKYNLLDDDDIFDEKNDESSEEDDLTVDSPKPLSDLTDDIDINIDDDDDLLETESSSSLDDQDFHTDLDITAIENDTVSEPAVEPDIEDSEPGSFTDYNPEEEDALPQSEDPAPFITDDYEDAKQEGLNYKPFVIVLAIIVGLAAIWFALDTFVFSSDEPEIVEEPLKTPEQLQQEKEAAEKAAFLGRLAGKTTSDISLINEILTYGKDNAKVSSILLYNQSLLFEVFGNNRDQVAKVNMALKNSNSGIPFEVIGSQTRPGSNGGVFGLFKTELGSSAASKNVSRVSFSSVGDFQSWVEQTSNSSNLKVEKLENNYLEEEGLFRKFKVEATINGSIDACNAFLQKLSSANNQVKIHKLNLTAADQRNFKSSNYLLKLILEVYV
jgi:acylphosphatase